MKNIFLLLILFLTSGGLSAQVFFTESFEANNTYSGSGGDCGCVGATANANDGQNDYFARSVDADISANTGIDYVGEVDASGNVGEGTAHYWAGEDIDDGGVQGSGNPEGCLTLTVNISGRTNLQFIALFGAHDVNTNQYEMDNHMQIDYNIDGAGFVELLDFREEASGATMSLDENGDDLGDGNTVIGQTFTEVSALIPGTGNSMQIQICMHSNTSSEEFAVDYVRVSEAMAMPVDLMTFNAQRKGSNVELDWHTASELNNDYFSIERSSDGTSFESIGRVFGNGTVNETQSYAHMDYDLPKVKTLYYRLAQVDFDGTTSYSEIKVVELDQITNDIRIFPNPIKQQATLTLGAETDEAIHATVISVSGQMMKQFVIPAASTEFQLRMEDLPQGNYFLRLQSSKWNETQRFLKIE